MSAIIAIDIGGTQLRAGVYHHDSTTPLKVEKVPSRGQEEGVLDRLFALIDSIWPKEPVEIICAAVPGPTNPHTGIIMETPNIPAWKNFPLAKKLSDRYQVPAHLGNDANMAVLGEWLYGAGKGHHDIVYLTISTGIGGGVVSGDKLIEGYRGLATELGHITVLPEGPVCSCGVRGHLEAVASGPGIARYVCEQIQSGRQSSLGCGPLTARQIAEAAHHGDDLAREAFQRAGEFIGHAIADYLHMFNPSIVIVGGGVSLAGDILLDPIKESFPKYVMNPAYVDGIEFTTARLGDDAGLLGSLAYAHVKLAGSSQSLPKGEK